MVPDISNPFFSLILRGIEETARSEGYAVLLGDTQHDQEREERYALMVRRKEADGLIFLGHRLPETASELIRSIAPGMRADRQRLRVQSTARNPERAHRQCRGRRRGDGSSLRARPSPDRHRDGTARQPAQPGPPPRRDRRGRSDQGRARPRSSRTATSPSSPGRSREICCSRDPIRRPRFSVSTTKWPSARSAPRAATPCACPRTCRSSGSTTCGMPRTRTRR